MTHNQELAAQWIAENMKRRINDIFKVYFDAMEYTDNIEIKRYVAAQLSTMTDNELELPVTTEHELLFNVLDETGNIILEHTNNLLKALEYYDGVRIEQSIGCNCGKTALFRRNEFNEYERI